MSFSTKNVILFKFIPVHFTKSVFMLFEFMYAFKRSIKWELQNSDQLACSKFADMLFPRVSLMQKKLWKRNEYKLIILKKTTHYRSSCPEVFYKKGVKKRVGNFAKFAGKQLCQSFFNKAAGLRPATLLKKRLCHGAFLWILWNF